MGRIPTYDDIEEYLVNGNLSLSGFLKHLYNKKSSLLSMPETAYEKYKKIYELLDEERHYYSESGKHKLTVQERGKMFEELIGCLFFFGNSFFNMAINCRTSTNEIDLLIDWSDMAITNSIPDMFEFIGNSFLCECKNYDKAVGVTYVGKFFSLLKVSNNKFGVMFITTKIAGKGKWDSAQGLIRKIALRDQTYIIDINWEDLTKIYNKEIDVIYLLKAKYMSSKNDVEFDKYISKHQFESDFSIVSQK